jgi:hypothetical protein
MLVGETIAGRFEIEASANTGGMGEVFRARDLTTGELVAVKVLLHNHTIERIRFAQEINVLAGLRHPGIVNYVAHGRTTAGLPYFVMEWLDGEDLGTLLARRRLAVHEAAELLTRVAEILAAMHAQGIVHRDLKPTNLFLLGGDVSRVKVLDLGIARLLGKTLHLTVTGTLVGTPGYMAPEQARGGHALDARVDIFSLGCVLFECLTGAPAFSGEHIMAILGKILFEDPPKIAELRSDVPPALDALIERMLAKDPQQRPRDGAELVAAAASLRVKVPVDASAEDLERPLRLVLTARERRLFAVMIVGPLHAYDFAAAATLGEHEMTLAEADLRAAAAAYGGHVEAIADGSALVTISGAKLATDLAALAARCALSLRAAVGGRPMALAIGRAEVTGRTPVGEAIDRAAAILARITRRGARESEAPPSRLGGPVSRGSRSPIGLDEITAGLLEPSFDVISREAGFELRGERRTFEGTRTLLGKATPCVGRERELATLESLFSQCVEEPMAQAVLVTAPAGLGKSRLAHELIQVIRGRLQEEVEIWIGRADTLRVSSALGLLGQVIRGACHIRNGEPHEAQHEKLRERVARHVPAADQARVVAFLAELAGAPLADGAHPALEEARQDARRMADETRRAWEDFLLAECSAHPVVLVLEDLHWSDLPTVRLLDATLHDLRNQPLLVLALARPEVHEIFPRLWADRQMQEVRLHELTRKASEHLVRQVLGATVEPDILARIVKQAEGHAFFLEELIRSVAEGKGESLPETVLAMVQARLDRLGSDARRVLRAASVFGARFRPMGVAALLGDTMKSGEVREWLAKLVEDELLVRRIDGAPSDEPDIAFRHALLREGAYATLTEADSALGHRLAATFLEACGESDPGVLAEHFSRGRDAIRASVRYLRAAEQALRGNDADAAITHATRGLEQGGADETTLALLGVLCEIHGWLSQWEAAASYAEKVFRLARPGSSPWARAITAKLVHAHVSGRDDEVTALLGAARGVQPSAGEVDSLAVSIAILTFTLDAGGHFALGELCLEWLLDIAGAPGVDRATSTAHEGTPAAILRGLAAPIRGESNNAFELMASGAAARRRALAVAHGTCGMHAWLLGSFDAAEALLRRAISQNHDVGPLSSFQSLFLAHVLADQGKLAEALAEAQKLTSVGQARRLPAEEGLGRAVLAEVLRRKSDLEAAEREALAAADLLSSRPLDRMGSMATLAAIRVAAGQSSLALESARESVGAYESVRMFDFYKGAFARLTLAEALFAAGEEAAARATLADARDRLLACAAAIAEPSVRRSFLERVPENARTMQLAAQWLT